MCTGNPGSWEVSGSSLLLMPHASRMVTRGLFFHISPPTHPAQAWGKAEKAVLRGGSPWPLSQWSRQRSTGEQQVFWVYKNGWKQGKIVNLRWWIVLIQWFHIKGLNLNWEREPYSYKMVINMPAKHAQVEWSGSGLVPVLSLRPWCVAVGSFAYVGTSFALYMPWLIPRVPFT